MPQYELWDPLHQLNWDVHKKEVTAVNVLCYQLCDTSGTFKFYRDQLPLAVGEGSLEWSFRKKEKKKKHTGLGVTTAALL